MFYAAPKISTIHVILCRLDSNYHNEFFEVFPWCVCKIFQEERATFLSSLNRMVVRIFLCGGFKIKTKTPASFKCCSLANLNQQFDLLIIGVFLPFFGEILNIIIIHKARQYKPRSQSFILSAKQNKTMTCLTLKGL